MAVSGSSRCHARGHRFGTHLEPGLGYSHLAGQATEAKRSSLNSQGRTPLIKQWWDQGRSPSQISVKTNARLIA